MAVPEELQSSSPPLSMRRQAYNEEVQRIVREGAEHPTCELVRELPLSTSEQKVNFSKLLQGLANAIITSEKLLIVGADESAKKFLPVTNLDDFDPARISQLLSKYLEPLPIFESFRFQDERGETFVTIVVAPKQPKPIIARTDIQADGGRFLLHKGDIWIKENTSLRRAARADLDTMYEEGSEILAKRWFDRLSTQLLSAQRFGNSAGIPIPQADLIYGDPQVFRLYVQTLIAGNHERQFRMLLDLLRDLAIDGWNKIGGYSSQAVEMGADYIKVVDEHARDYFLPAVKRIGELGLLLVKHSGNTAWLDLVARLLAEVFDSSARLVKLSVRDVIEREVSAAFGRYLPGLEAAIGIRALAIYALRREEYGALSFLMKRYVKNLIPPRRALHPFLFWPVPARIKMPEGLMLFCWRYRIEAAWGEYFGSAEEYERLATQLEFLLEFNSWLGISPEGTAWLTQHKKDASFAYFADIWGANLNDVVGLAERIYESLRGSQDILSNITVEKILLDVRLKLVPGTPELLLAAYLDYLVISQRRLSLQMGRFPYTVEWGERIGPLIKDYRERKEKGTLPSKLEFLPQ